MAPWSSVGAVASVLVGSASSTWVTELSKQQWLLSNPRLNISIPARIPSVAHLDLYQAQVIGDPYYGLNDFNLRWVAWSNWTYSTWLDLEGLGSKTWLLFDGLDTFTDIRICGQHVASTNNQFRQYYFDVTPFASLCPRNATLSINFGSAAKIAEQIANEPGQETWPEGVEGVFEFPHRQFVRKEQSDFGWDWGPAFVPAGPWQPAYMIKLGPSDLYVRNSLVDIYRQGQINLIPPDQSQPWVVNGSLDVLGEIPEAASLSYSLTDLDGNNVSSGVMQNVTVQGRSITGSVVIPSNKVKLWWPVGMGDQNLYLFRLTINTGGQYATTTKRVGFRTIVLNQEPIREDQLANGVAPGANWHFEINGHEFYAKGSNMIPPDAFWPRVTTERIRDLFEAALKGNQNMLRVWASGAYLPDFAYNLADEMGLLLWSEFQFGVALYPANPEFLANVYEEAVYQVRRINHHPSLALWAGGNELENLELNMVRRNPLLFEKYLSEYEALFLDTLVPAVFENSRSISYTPSSTGNGWKTLNFSRAQPIEQRYYDTVYGEIYGDTDYYNYDSTKAFSYWTYPVGRFANEFGFHSMPSIHSWREVLPPEEIRFESEMLRLRNHHYAMGGLNTTDLMPSNRGIAEMDLAAQHWYPTPHKMDHDANFAAWCLVTQIFQAEYCGAQIQFYRRGSGMPERQLGSLYWQLEDIWQAPTWAGIEYDGRWKVLHYKAKDLYKNVIVSPFYYPTKNNLQVYVTSDLWAPATGWVSFQWINWKGEPLPVPTPSSASVSVGALNTTLVLDANTTTLMANLDPADMVLVMETSVRSQLPNSDTSREFRHRNFWHAASLVQANLVDPGLRWSHSPLTKTFTIQATTGVAAWVWLDYGEGALVHFEDNGFFLVPGRPVPVGYEVKWDRTGGAWVNTVTVTSIWDNNIP